jgi:hypothetical protein
LCTAIANCCRRQFETYDNHRHLIRA